MNIVSRIAVWLLTAVALQSIGGCGVAAFPCRAFSATLKVVPLIGHPAAVPFDACAAAID